MKIILLEDVKALGKKDDVVEISDGYARNMILPKKKGIEATPQNLNNLKLKKQNLDKLAVKQLDEAKEIAAMIENKSIEMEIKTGKDGRAFGSISTKEVAVAIKQQLKMELDRKKMQLDTPIKGAGTYKVSIKLHPQVTADLSVIVKGTS
ncbi:MAG: 50S ribosomal protein L9 [Lachnoclostridium sp.]|jgi:large subunit ribosomal protein L9|nr:50S ribosomal protein L9 [Lachnoclostridium sp.]